MTHQMCLVMLCRWRMHARQIYIPPHTHLLQTGCLKHCPQTC